MKHIVILDSYTANPGDLSWEHLEELGDLSIYERTEPHEIVDRCQDADIIFTNKVVLGRATLEKLKKLKYIGVLASGVNNIDLDAAKDYKISVCNVPGYSGQSVAQQIMAMILDHCHKITEHSLSVRKGDWSHCPDFSYTVGSLTELDGKTLGIYGYGDIGSRLAHMALPFGMKVLIHKRTPPQSLPKGVEFCDANKLFESSDFISLNCPLTSKTENLINETSLKSMKKTAVLINTGRGQLINENALSQALKSRDIAACYLDVLSSEPPPIDHPLLGTPNCKITPHIAWATPEARKRLLEISVSNLKSYLNSTPVNQVV
jgi:glycerate dehydrogenase